MIIDIHYVTVALGIILLITRIKAIYDQRKFMEGAKEIQESAIALVAPLREQSQINAAATRDCIRRVEYLEDRLHRWTVGFDLIEIDARRQGRTLPWYPRDDDKFYVGRGRKEYL